MKKALAADVTSQVWRRRIMLGQEPVKLMNEAVLVEMNNPFVNIAINIQPVVTSNQLRTNHSLLRRELMAGSCRRVLDRSQSTRGTSRLWRQECDETIGSFPSDYRV